MLPVPPPGPIPVFVEYDGATRKARTRKWFPDGLDRAAKDFFLQLSQEGKRPRVVAADDVPVPKPKPRPKPKPKRKRKRKPAQTPEPAFTSDALFDNPPEQLPD